MFARTRRIPLDGGLAAGRNPARARLAALAAGILLCALSAPAPADQSHPALRVYGPGGPHEALSECATLYRRLHGDAVLVLRSGPVTMSQKVALDGDLYYGGAEFMLEEFDRDNPGVLDRATVAFLYPRRVGIIVRRGNPLGIRSLTDLDRAGVRVMKVTLEKVSEFHEVSTDPDGSRHPVAHSGEEALKAWRADPDIDAWITYRSWHRVLAAEADFIEIPDERALRFTPIAITAATPHRAKAAKFIAFLKTPEAGRIFAEHGWD